MNIAVPAVRISDSANCRESSWIRWRHFGVNNGFNGVDVDWFRGGDGTVIHYCLRHIPNVH